MVTQGAVPGARDGRTTSPRQILASRDNVAYVPAGGILDATFSFDGSQPSGREQEMREGIPLGKITASGLWVPCKRTQVNMTSATVTELVVDDASLFQVADTLTIGADTTVAVSAINYSTNTITIASTAVVDDEVVFADQAAYVGGEICRGFLNQFIEMVDEDDQVARDRTLSRILINGIVNEDMILGDLAAIRAMVEGTTKFLAGINFAEEKGFQAEVPV